MDVCLLRFKYSGTKSNNFHNYELYLKLVTSECIWVASACTITTYIQRFS